VTGKQEELDIQTGDLYRDKARITDELIRYINLQINTDGAECHKKSKFTLLFPLGEESVDAIFVFNLVRI
jgi:hypothetical protein